MSRWYRTLLRLYPRAFREAHGDEMESVFHASVRLYGRRWGRLGIPLAWLRALLDTLWHAPRLHLARARGLGGGPFGERRSSAGTTRHLLGALLEDAGSGARHLLRNRAFTLTAVGVLALGIGLTAEVFGVVYSLLLRPLPGVDDPDRLVQVYRTRVGGDEFLPSSLPLYRDIRDGSPVFSGVTAWTFATLSVGTGDRAERVTAQIVSPEFFRVLGVHLLRGRDFDGGGARVVVVSERFWRTWLGGVSDVVGNTLEINGETWEIVGVAPGEFRGPIPVAAPALWAPLSLHATLMGSGEQSENRGNNFLEVVARLGAGAGMDQARAWAAGFSAGLQAEYPELYQGMRVRLYPQKDAGIHPSIRSAQIGLSGVVLGVVGLLLVIACVNVASLFLGTAQVRAQEMVLRSSLGAHRRRLVAQLLLESLQLCLLAGGVGIALAWGMTRALNQVRIPLQPDLEWYITLDWPVLAFTLGVTLLTSLLFGLTPALRLTRPDLATSLNGAGARLGARRQRGGRILVGGQVAVATVLLVCAGLFVRNLRDAMEVDLGFRSDRMVLATLDAGLLGWQPEVTAETFSTLADRIAALPDVQAVTLARFVPLGVEGAQRGVDVPGHVARPGESRNIHINMVRPGYFAAMGIPVLEGRPFLDEDARPPEAHSGGGAGAARGGGNEPAPAVVNQAFVDRFWGGRSAVGRAFNSGGQELEVVGVVPTGKYQRLGEPPLPFIYLPWPRFRSDLMNLHVRAAGDPAPLPSVLRRVARSEAPALPVVDVRTMDDQLSFALLPARAAAVALGAFGTICVLLLSVGIHGVVTLSVAQRTREVGIRVALGARPRSATGLVVREEARVVIVGIALGLVGAMAAARVLGAVLYSGKGLDPVVFLGAPIILAVAAAAATWGPARRAAGVDPAQALRER